MDLSKQESINQLNLVANNIKVLALEAITNANSGHPGIVLSGANIMTVLFQNHLNVNPNELEDFNRDRLIMDSGHGSALLYATMVVYQYNSLNTHDLRHFRQLRSLTPGHPESHLTTGVEYTTGPLGQGSAASVGFAIAESHLAALYNRFQPNLIQHYTYCYMSDGSFEEGINYEALTLAGKYQLNRLIFLYDSNRVQLDGNVIDSTITNKEAYFTSLGLNYIYCANGHDFLAIDEAIKKAKTCKDKPSIIEFHTILGLGTTYADTNKSHGTVLTEEQLIAFKRSIDWNFPEFTVLQTVNDITNEFVHRGIQNSKIFSENLNQLQKKYPNVYEQLQNDLNQNYQFSYAEFQSTIDELKASNSHSTREILGALIQPILKKYPNFMLTNPDISSSTKIKKNFEDLYSFQKQENSNIACGVREFAALSLINGMTAHKGLKALTACFLSFLDYNKAALRLASIARLPILDIYSHDSIMVGEDGPTHQPIEQLTCLRSIPNLNVYRPCNIDETIAALQFFLKTKTTPTCIITSRQKFKDCYSNNLEDISKGGYIFEDAAKIHMILIATGSEVALALQIKSLLQEQYQLGVRIVSMPSTYLFDQQDETYKKQVLCLDKKFIFSLEFGATMGWYKYADHPFGVDKFGLSAKDSDLMKTYKLQANDLAQEIVQILNQIVSERQN